MSDRELTYVQALNEALHEEMGKDPQVIVIGEDVAEFGGVFGVTKGLWERFGASRVRSTPISEAAIAGAAVGAALTGLRPVAEIMYVDFMTISMDQIVNQAAKVRYMFGGKAKVPIVFRANMGSGRGNAAQHSQSLEAWFAHVPGLKVVMPSTPYDAKGLLKAAIRDDNVVIFLENKILYRTKGYVPEEEYVIPLGAADVKREGSDVTVVAVSQMVPRALQAAKVVEGKGINPEIIDLRTVSPLDKETIFESVKKTGRLIVVHESCKSFGVGGEVAALVCESDCFNYLDGPIVRLGGKDVPMPCNRNLEAAAIPTVEDIVSAIERVYAGAGAASLAS
ncbi:MAG: alpha-ketoacid dehydrogenase subunit beta [Firmicutes bacterium]|nr:alpha-ketoacid dehydrogenase subunit beta [Bacillota bacterium]